MGIWLFSPRGLRGSAMGTTAGMRQGQILDFCINKIYSINMYLSSINKYDMFILANE